MKKASVIFVMGAVTAFLAAFWAGFSGPAGNLSDAAASGRDSRVNGASALLYYSRPVRDTMSGSYLAARHAQHIQDWTSADRFISAVIDMDARDDIDPELQKKAMILAMGSGQSARAVARARQVLGLEPDNPLALLFVTVEAFAAQDYVRALEMLESMPEEAGMGFARPLLISWARAAKGELAIDDLKGNALHAYHALLVAEHLGRLDDHFEPYLDMALAESAIGIYELEKIADLHVAVGRKDKALELYRLITSQQPGLESAVQKMAWFESGENDESGENVKSGVNGDKTLEPPFLARRITLPENGAAEALFSMGRTMYQRGSDDSARVFTQMALYLNPGLTEARILMANLLAGYERFDDAISYFAAVPESDPSFLDVQRSIADFLESADRTEEAIVLLNRLVEEREDLKSLIRIGEIYRRGEQFEKAIDAYDRAEKMMGGQIPESHWNLLYARGMTYERLGEWDKAERDLKAALAFRPNHPYILNYLGYSWADQGIYLKESLDMIKQAADLRPRDGYIADSLGWALYRMGRYAESVPHLEKAVELLPYDRTINDHLGDSYWWVGRKLEARFQWRRALNTEEEDAQHDVSAETLEHKIKNGLPAAADDNPGDENSIRAAKTETESLDPNPASISR